MPHPGELHAASANRTPRGRMKCCPITTEVRDASNIPIRRRSAFRYESRGRVVCRFGRPAGRVGSGRKFLTVICFHQLLLIYAYFDCFAGGSRTAGWARSQDRTSPLAVHAFTTTTTVIRSLGHRLLHLTCSA